MPRYPSDRSIRRRAEIAYHRAQALARNQRYQADVAFLQGEGYRFRADGFEDPYPSPGYLRARAEDPYPPPGELSARAKAIRERAGLTRLMLPERLRALTVEEIEDYPTRRLFVDVPGWDMTRVETARPGATRVPDFVEPGAIRWYVQKPVSLRGLGKRHRLTSYPAMWQVYDAWHEGRARRGWERRVIDTVWPGEWKRRPYGYEKAPIHQRMYDHLAAAGRLLEAAYPV